MPHGEKTADVRMIQAGNRPSFALESLSQFRTISKIRGQNLDGDNAVEARIFGEINGSANRRPRAQARCTTPSGKRI
jgi:hypothetical protein